jgi:DNA-binding response OmpR family regulator
MAGFEMVRRLRQHDRQTPVLFLTARSAINDVVEGFELGANDYLKKPFGMQELIVRIKALANRFDTRGAKEPAAQAAAGTTAIGRYLFNPLQQRLEIDGTQQQLSHREAQLLRMLSDNRGTVVGTQAILLDLWGDDSFFNTRSLQVFITRLRHRLAQDEHIRIINVRGIGYKLLC